MGKITKIFGKIEDPETRGVIKGAETFSALVPEVLIVNQLIINTSGTRALNVSASLMTPRFSGSSIFPNILVILPILFLTLNQFI
jgi:hypothetical protein